MVDRLFSIMLLLLRARAVGAKLSLKSIPIPDRVDTALATPAALLEVKAALTKVNSRLDTSLTLSLAVACPVKVRVNSVLLARVSTAVSPEGTLLMLALLLPIKSSPLVPVKVSPSRLMLAVPVRVPLLVSVSVKKPARSYWLISSPLVPTRYNRLPLSL